MPDMKSHNGLRDFVVNSSPWCVLSVTTALCASAPLEPPAKIGFDARGVQFICFEHFSSFEKSPGTRARELVLTSPTILTKINWNELIASWNVQLPPGTYMQVAARAIRPQGPTKFYTLGLWSNEPDKFPRESVPGQRDEQGTVSTDTLVLNEPVSRFQLQVTLGSETRLRPKLKFLGISVTDTSVTPRILTPNKAVWGTVLPVPERSQMVYSNGNVLCSPTTVSMLMSYWSQVLHRPDLDHDVPEIVEAIYDAQWKGTGNWPFNTAYAGSFRGMRGYVARLTDVSEVEDWVAHGVPVGLSLCYDRLRGKQPQNGGNGHLVVCVGFTEDGDPVINDPGTSRNVRKVFPRKNLISAWAYSKNAVYLVYPESREIPKDQFGHWASWTARQRLKFE